MPRMRKSGSNTHRARDSDKNRSTVVKPPPPLAASKFSRAHEHVDAMRRNVTKGNLLDCCAREEMRIIERNGARGRGRDASYPLVCGEDRFCRPVRAICSASRIAPCRVVFYREPDKRPLFPSRPPSFPRFPPRARTDARARLLDERRFALSVPSLGPPFSSVPSLPSLSARRFFW